MENYPAEVNPSINIFASHACVPRMPIRYHRAMNIPRPSPADHVRWQAERIEALQKPDGWLSLVGLFWIDDGSHRVGSGADCEIQLPSGPALLGALDVKGSTAQWQAVSGPAITLNSDADGEPTVVRHDSLSFLLIERDGRLALRLRDAEAQTRRNFSDIPSFDFDAAWCIDARWDGARAHFSIDGNAYSLGPQNPKATTLQFVFADATSGRATYGGGRFLFVPAPQGDTLLLDFNRASNPPCVFTPYATCPLPAAENRLPIAITAGEQNGH